VYDTRPRGYVALLVRRPIRALVLEQIVFRALFITLAKACPQSIKPPQQAKPIL